MCAHHKRCSGLTLESLSLWLPWRQTGNGVFMQLSLVTLTVLPFFLCGRAPSPNIQLETGTKGAQKPEERAAFRVGSGTLTTVFWRAANSLNTVTVSAYTSNRNRREKTPSLPHIWTATFTLLCRLSPTRDDIQCLMCQLPEKSQTFAIILFSSNW